MRWVFAIVVGWGLVALAGARPAAGDVQVVNLFSPANGRIVPFRVYTPPGYSSSTSRYPVVFSLHGLGGAPGGRANQVVPTLDAAFAAGTVRPMIYVFPDGQTNSFYGDAFDGHKQVHSNVISEIVPYVDANFRTMNDRSFRAIDGFSMGGYGALMYAAQRTDLFSAVVGYAGALADWQGLIPSIKQEMYNNVEANFTPFSLWDVTAQNHELMRARLDMLMICGAADTLLARNRQYNVYLETLGIDVPLHEIPGVGHDGAALYRTGRGLAFLDQHFRSVGGPIGDSIRPKGFDNTVLLPEAASAVLLMLPIALACRRRRAVPA
jgi:endo-1,4-beta-xylanase